MTMAQAWLFIASGLAGPARGIHRVRKGALPKGALMKGAVGVCVAASAIALAPCANADDDSFLANLSQHGIFTFKPAGLGGRRTHHLHRSGEWGLKTGRGKPLPAQPPPSER
jgi:hypothetical protein